MLNHLDISLIRELPPFRDMAEGDVRKLLKQARTLSVTKGDYVFSQGEEATRFFLLLDGFIRVVKLTSGGQQIIPRFIVQGELFGIAKAIGVDAYPANAVAASDCRVLSWSNSIWDDTISRHPTFAENSYRTVGNRLMETHQQLVEIATARVEQRVARAVLKLAQQAGLETSDGTLIKFPISRQDISEMTGTTLHTVSRLLSAWENSGWIKSGRRKITVTERNKIAIVANNSGAQNVMNR